MSIEIKHLNHIYAEGTPFETKALDDICLTIPDGAFAGIIGHTGSGKSTLIAHLNGLERSPEGTVIVNGMDLGAKGTDLITVRKTVGLVFQYPEYQLFEETVAKDIAFGPKNLKIEEKEIAQRVRLAMQQVGLDESCADKSPFDLSGGQKRRVAIAGVLAMQPDILILDEPAAGLDPAGRMEIMSLIKRIHEQGTTVIMVSHSMDDVARLCDCLFVLDHGRLAYSGSREAVFSHADELHRIGLDVPECAKLANLLRQKGFALEEGMYRAEEVKQAILSAFRL